jgi:hypothetical protein
LYPVVHEPAVPVQTLDQLKTHRVDEIQMDLLFRPAEHQ